MGVGNRSDWCNESSGSHSIVYWMMLYVCKYSHGQVFLTKTLNRHILIVSIKLTRTVLMFYVMSVETRPVLIILHQQQEDSAEQMFAEMDESVADMLEYKDDGCIELVLKVLARICDGQHTGLQVMVRFSSIVNEVEYCVCFKLVFVLFPFTFLVS